MISGIPFRNGHVKPAYDQDGNVIGVEITALVEPSDFGEIADHDIRVSAHRVYAQAMTKNARSL